MNNKDYIVTVKTINKGTGTTALIMVPISAVNKDEAKALVNNTLFFILRNEVEIEFINVSLASE